MDTFKFFLVITGISVASLTVWFFVMDSDFLTEYRLSHRIEKKLAISFQDRPKLLATEHSGPFGSDGSSYLLQLDDTDCRVIAKKMAVEEQEVNRYQVFRRHGIEISELWIRRTMGDLFALDLDSCVLFLM